MVNYNFLKLYWKWKKRISKVEGGFKNISAHILGGDNPYESWETLEMKWKKLKMKPKMEGNC